MNGEIILLNIQRFVASLYLALPVMLDSSEVSHDCLAYFNLSQFYECHSNIFVKWIPPIIH